LGEKLGTNVCTMESFIIVVNNVWTSYLKHSCGQGYLLINWITIALDI